jgi:hypothetical protein
MASELIKCPECGAEFPLSKAVSHNIEISVSKKYEKQIKDLKDESQKILGLKEKELQEQFKRDKKQLEEKGQRETEEATKKLESEKKQIAEQAKKQAQEAVGVELADLRESLADKEKKILESQKNELELRRKQRELEQKEQSLELELTRKLDEERKDITDNARKDFEKQQYLKDAEKDKKLTDLNKQVDELKRKLEQGSQKMQGEILELEMEEVLKTEFPFDEIEPVPPGIKGADAIQVVKTQTGKACGKIIWETKRTRAWCDSWLQKVKDDKRVAKADIAILVSETLPKEITNFRIIDGVWVTSISTAISLAWALRMLLIQVEREKQLQSGKKGKMELVYNYLIGPEFKNRVEAIVESFIKMKGDLDSERRAMNKIWDKREKQIETVILNIGGMHSDIEGISGMTLPVIKALELPNVSEELAINENEDAEISTTKEYPKP